MIRLVFNFILIFTLFTCSGEQRRPLAEDDDFGLDDEDSAQKVDDRGYFGDLQRSDATLGFESSFPLPFAVGKSIDLFETAPEQAKNPGSSQLSVQLGSCRFNLKTAAVQVDRFILAGQWIKLSEALPAGVPVRLEPHMDLNLKLASKVMIEVPATELVKCKALLAGQRVYLGRFHLNKSKIGLLAGPGYPRAVFSSRSMEPKGKRIFIRWQASAAAPMLIDDFDFPATSESGIFRAFMADRGYYYLVFQPTLRMDQVDQLVIKIPFQLDPKTSKPVRKKSSKRKPLE